MLSCKLFLTDTGLDCGLPPELENGRMSNLSITTTYNSTVTYECKDGYYFHNNDTSRTCLSSGNWSDENILCISTEEDSICEGIFCPFGAGVLTAIFISAAVILVLLCLAGGCVVRQRLRKSKRSSNISDRKANTLELRALPEVQGSSLSSVPTLKEELSTKRMLFESSQLQLTKVVGQGESGLVYRGYIRENEGNMLVAIKTGKALVAVTDRERLLKEVSLMLTFSHPNVMPLIGLSFDEETPLIIMPFMSNGTVLSYVRDNRKSLYFLESSDNIQVEAAKKTCLGICYQISNGMAYLANYRLVHRDLAARNCMIDEKGIIKVADFGLTEDMYSTIYYRQEKRQTGTEEKVPIKWMALESIETHVFDESTDVWSFGVTCWEVFTCGGVPYAGVPVTTLLRELRSGHRLDRPSNISCSDDIWSVVTSCWSASPQERPKFSTLVNTLTDLLDSDSNYIKLLG
ncbi:Tyrosine-protein kinase transforming protein SEA [Geodia barretti]|uniref:Tyrosine-protein kinase transforming protein SEA n=4 Tax=Geodia barretti TaxID=519541 RepID=A0AA35X5R1_GEOBA|nr:Tyrosine-protein kinase transforming protein SEA [Geodia barretti]